MRFDISRAGNLSSGLRVIGHIPDYRLCHLEGRNGIGKSVGARLLELATGGQPYAAQPHAWRTLKAQLGPTQITVTGLPGGQIIRFDVDPQRSWPDDPVGNLADEFARVSIDNIPATAREVQALLRVRRVSGDETLLQTLARDLEERAVIAETVQRQWVRPVAADWEVRLTGLVELIGGVNRVALLDAWERQKDAATAAEMGQARAATAVAVSDAADHAVAAADGLAARHRDLPALVTGLASSLDELAAARAALDKANERAEQAAIALAGGSSLRGEIDRWERLLRYRQRAVQREQIEERQLLSALKLPSRPDALELARRMREAAEAVDAEIARRDRIDLVEPRRRLALQMEAPLAAETHRLGGEIIANTAPPITVNGLLAGVQDLRADLTGRPRPDELVRLDREIDRAQRQQELLRALEAQARVTDRKQQRLAEANETLADLFADLDASDRSTYEQAQDSAERARDAVISAELHTRELRKQIAELLDIPAQRAVADERTAAPNGDDEDEQDGADDPPADPLYPNVDEAFATRVAVDADAEAIAVLDRVDVASLAEAAAVGGPVDLAALRAAAAESPLASVTEAGLDQLRLLHAAATRVRAAAAACQEDAKRAEATAGDAARRLETLRAAANAARAKLSAGGPTEWEPWASAAAPLFAAAGAPPADWSPGPEEGEPATTELAIADALEAVAAIARAQTAAVFALADRLASLSGYLGSVAANVAPGVRDAGSATPADYQRTLGASLRTWVENALADSLTTPALLTELFDGATEVRVGLDDLTLTWRPRAGGVRKRPLEAFSSGEQVFAYTRANLMRIGRDRRPGQSVVVILDEFGAFVARDRLGQLMHFVEHEALGTVANQVVVMLPVSRGYPAPSGSTPLREGELSDADSIETRGRQIADRGYFAVPFTAGSARLI